MQAGPSFLRNSRNFDSHELRAAKEDMNASSRNPTVVDALPKAETHLHLEGSIRPDTAVELAARHEVALKRESVLQRYSYKDFNGFLQTFKWVTSYLQTPEDYALITRKLAEELLAQHVVYAEVTISAGVMLRRSQNVEANVQAIRSVADSVPFSRLKMVFILDAARQFGHEEALKVAIEAGRLQQLGVVGFGMGGDELAFPTDHFRPAFDHARREGLRIVCHAGEVGGPALIREAVTLLGAERIGHGIATMNDPSLADWLITRHITLENCPTSNLCTGALAKQLAKPEAALEDHPLPAFLKRGLLVTLSTDDPALFHTDLLTEYSKASSIGITNGQLVQLAETSYQTSFLPPDQKQKYISDFRNAAKSAGLV
jgi:adenosine deaminase/aminodeoxyfutalosine deaminase